MNVVFSPLCLDDVALYREYLSTVRVVAQSMALVAGVACGPSTLGGGLCGGVGGDPRASGSVGARKFERQTGVPPVKENVRFSRASSQGGPGSWRERPQAEVVAGKGAAVVGDADGHGVGVERGQQQLRVGQQGSEPAGSRGPPGSSGGLESSGGSGGSGSGGPGRVSSPVPSVGFRGPNWERNHASRERKKLAKAARKAASQEKPRTGKVGLLDVLSADERKRLAEERVRLYRLRNEFEALRLERVVMMEKQAKESGAAKLRIDNWVEEVKAGGSHSFFTANKRRDWSKPWRSGGSEQVKTKIAPKPGEVEKALAKNSQAFRIQLAEKEAEIKQLVAQVARMSKHTPDWGASYS